MAFVAADSSRSAVGLDVRLVVDAIPALAWSSHPDGAVEFVNQKWCDYTGLAPEESHGWGWKAAVHSEDLPKLLAKWGDLRRAARMRGSIAALRWRLSLVLAPARTTARRNRRRGAVVRDGN